MNEVENLYHATPQHYYKCIRERFGNEKIGETGNFLCELFVLLNSFFTFVRSGKQSLDG